MTDAAENDAALAMVDDASSPVHLGFIEPIEDTEQLRRIGHRSANFDDWDGGQVGGCPSWLDPVHLPEPSCPVCQDNMKFVCQLYAPVDEYEDRAFHRTLYVFGCSKCQHDKNNTAQSMVVYRCQLPQENPYYPANPSPENTSTWNRHLPESHDGVQVCQVCGCRGKYKCPLQQLYFCGKDHQKEYKKHVFDKIKADQVPLDLPSIFPIAELAVDAELGDDNADDQANRETLFENDENDSDAELEQDDLNRMTGKKGTAVEQDAYTQTFMQRIKRQPDQALRYARWKVGDHNHEDQEDAPDDNDQVLWIRKDYRPTHIPDCPYCGAKRRFEFQLMPQMLDHLNRHATGVNDPAAAETYQQYKHALQQAEDLIREAPPESIPPALVENKERAAAKMRDYLLNQQQKSTLDFGVVAVFTCVQSCGTFQEESSSLVEGGPVYRQEYAWCQPCLDLS